MQWYEKIIAAHRAVTDNVSHSERLKSDRYFVWEEEGAVDFFADGRHAEKAVTGTSDLFTKTDFDPWKEKFEKALDDFKIAWELISIDYEEDTGFYHYEWEWAVT